VPDAPDMIQKQEKMVKEKDPVSPFLAKHKVEPILIQEENPKVKYSPVHEHLYKELEERKQGRTISPTRYTDNINTIKTMRQGRGIEKEEQGT